MSMKPLEPRKEQVIKELTGIIKERQKNDSEDTETILTDLLSEGFSEEDIKTAFKRLKLL